MWERVHITQDMSRSCSSCDCITYSYFLISVFLFALGSIISMFSFGAFDETVYVNLGHMWMFGPLCICSAMMIGVRNVLYLRRRRIIDMVIRQQIAVKLFFLKCITLQQITLVIKYNFTGHPISTSTAGRFSATVFIANTNGERTYFTSFLRTVDWQP